MFYWDLRGNRGTLGEHKPFLGVLDLVWKPFLRVPLSAMDNTFDYGLTKATIRAGIKTGSNLSLSKSTKSLEAISTSKFYCATEEGDLIIADWVGEKSSEEKGQASSRVEYAFSRHFGTVSDLRRSPFFPDILLSVGGWSFHIWKEGYNVHP